MLAVVNNKLARATNWAACLEAIANILAATANVSKNC